jgi:hypothetical protein
MTMSGAREFEAFCRQNGIPVDRARLVERNVILSAQVRAYDKALCMFYEAFHDGKGHGMAFAECSRDGCVKFRELLAKLRDDSNRNTKRSPR